MLLPGSPRFNTMNVDLQQFKRDGYLILRQVIPPELLDDLRSSFEKLVNHQREIWVRERKPGDPPGGQWETQPQPRIALFCEFIDESTENAIKICLHENTRGVCRQLMQAEEAAVANYIVICNPSHDHGPGDWHRDMHSIDQAPMRGLQRDLMENAPAYLQWNIPLYDDDVFWVLPGSHSRLNTEAEHRQLAENPRIPLPGGIPVELQAGDGVVYTNTILHWGSNYSNKLRRVIHPGYRSLGGPSFPYLPGSGHDQAFTQCVSPNSQKILQRQYQMYLDECEVIVSLYRAMIDKDEGCFREALAKLHPGESQRIVCVILMSKLAYKICHGAHPARASFAFQWTQDKQVGPCFSDVELDIIWQRFSALDAALQSETDQFLPGYHSGPTNYYFEEMPDFDLGDFIASWDD